MLLGLCVCFGDKYEVMVVIEVVCFGVVLVSYDDIMIE